MKAPATMRLRALALWLPGVLMALLAWWLPRIAQPPEYHQFADQSLLFGIPHFYDTISNVLFVLAGLTGQHFICTPDGRRALSDRREALPYMLFFIAVTLVGFGSGYYHLAPDNARLAWDRTGIALALMAWFAAVLCERIGIRFELAMLPLLLAAGLGSVLHWSWSEAIGQGDLRLYGLMQLIPLVYIPLLLWLFPPRQRGDRDTLVVLALYLLALACDFLDRPIAALTGFVSGHTLKHAIAATAAYWVVIRLKRRLPA